MEGHNAAFEDFNSMNYSTAWQTVYEQPFQITLAAQQAPEEYHFLVKTNFYLERHHVQTFTAYNFNFSRQDLTKANIERTLFTKFAEQFQTELASTTIPLCQIVNFNTSLLPFKAADNTSIMITDLFLSENAPFLQPTFQNQEIALNYLVFDVFAQRNTTQAPECNNNLEGRICNRSEPCTKNHSLQFYNNQDAMIEHKRILTRKREHSGLETNPSTRHRYSKTQHDHKAARNVPQVDGADDHEDDDQPLNIINFNRSVKTTPTFDRIRSTIPKDFLLIFETMKHKLASHFDKSSFQYLCDTIKSDSDIVVPKHIALPRPTLYDNEAIQVIQDGWKQIIAKAQRQNDMIFTVQDTRIENFKQSKPLKLKTLDLQDLVLPGNPDSRTFLWSNSIRILRVARWMKAVKADLDRKSWTIAIENAALEEYIDERKRLAYAHGIFLPMPFPTERHNWSSQHLFIAGRLSCPHSYPGSRTLERLGKEEVDILFHLEEDTNAECNGQNSTWLAKYHFTHPLHRMYKHHDFPEKLEYLHDVMYDLNAIANDSLNMVKKFNESPYPKSQKAICTHLQVSKDTIATWSLTRQRIIIAKAIEMFIRIYLTTLAVGTSLTWMPPSLRHIWIPRIRTITGNLSKSLRSQLIIEFRPAMEAAAELALIYNEYYSDLLKQAQRQALNNDITTIKALTRSHTMLSLPAFAMQKFDNFDEKALLRITRTLYTRREAFENDIKNITTQHYIIPNILSALKKHDQNYYQHYEPRSLWGTFKRATFITDQYQYDTYLTEGLYNLQCTNCHES